MSRGKGKHPHHFSPNTQFLLGGLFYSISGFTAGAILLIFPQKSVGIRCFKFGVQKFEGIRSQKLWAFDASNFGFESLRAADISHFGFEWGFSSPISSTKIFDGI